VLLKENINLHHGFNLSFLLKNKIIRQLGALLLLLLFVVSNTPKQALHDLFANHIDSKKGQASSSTIPRQISQLSYHCQCDHLVVESPYTYSDQTIVYYLPFNYRQFVASPYLFIFGNKEFQLVLRGPPAV
jgi:hypothetical protein